MNPAIQHHEGLFGESAPPVRWALASLSLTMLLSSLGTSIANIALPTLASELGAPFQVVQWVVVAYLLATTSTIVGMGRLGDAIGRRRLLQAGLLLFTAASVVSSVAPVLWLVIAARAAQGLGAAAMMALTIAFVSDIVPKDKTGSAMGLLGTTSAIGTALGPSLGGVLIDGLGWRSIFAINVPLGLVAIVLARRYLPADRPTAQRGAFDYVGTLLLAFTLTAYALAMTLGRGHFGWLNGWLSIAAATGVVAFVVVERKASAPLIRLSMFRDPALSASLAASLLVSAVVMATLVVGPFYLSRALGLDAGVVGLVMSMGPIVAAVTGIPAGRIVDRAGTHRTSLAGLGGLALGSFVMSVAPENILGYLVPIVVITGSYALFQAANNTAVMRDVSADTRGVVSGMLNLSRNLGLITGASVMGAVFASAAGMSDVTSVAPGAVAEAMRTTFVVAAAMGVVALVMTAGGRALASRAALFITAALALFAGDARAQQDDPASPEADERSSVLGDHRFMVGSDDGVSTLRISGLFQPQYAHAWLEGAPNRSAFLVNRGRVALSGTVLSKDLSYLFVADFGRSDVRLVYYSADYTFVPGALTARVGQFKRPFSRSFLTPSSALSMIDRPLTVGPNTFGDDADLGVMLHNGAERFEYAVGVFDGSGSAGVTSGGVGNEHVHPLLAARVGYNTPGLKGYSESDLEGGGPRFGVAIAGMADFDRDGDDRSFVSGVVDVALEVDGLSLESAFYAGTRQDGTSWVDQKVSAIGHHTQLGYVVADVVEPVVRYAFLRPEDATEHQHDLAGGLNVFFHGHALKLQNFVNVRFRSTDGSVAEDVGFKSQLTLAL